MLLLLPALAVAACTAQQQLCSPQRIHSRLITPVHAILLLRLLLLPVAAAPISTEACSEPLEGLRSRLRRLTRLPSNAAAAAACRRQQHVVVEVVERVRLRLRSCLLRALLLLRLLLAVLQEGLL